MGSCPKQVLVWFEHLWQQGCELAGIGHMGLLQPQGEKWLKQQAKDRHQVFSELKKLCLLHTVCQGGDDGEQMCHLQLFLKMLIMQIESLIRVLKKEPHILWGVGCAQSSVLADCSPGNHSRCQTPQLGLLFSACHLESQRRVLWGAF